VSLLVVDASLLAAWVLPSQSTMAADSLRFRLAAFDPIAPDFIRIELRALLSKAERRGAIDAAKIAESLALIDALNVQYAPALDNTDLDQAMTLALSSRISLYDALYLDLAIGERAVLASRDGGLLAAATAQGVAIEDCR
jgi:predicted nucleic acid-binding protein